MGKNEDSVFMISKSYYIWNDSGFKDFFKDMNSFLKFIKSSKGLNQIEDFFKIIGHSIRFARSEVWSVNYEDRIYIDGLFKFVLPKIIEPLITSSAHSEDSLKYSLECSSMIEDTLYRLHSHIIFAGSGVRLSYFITGNNNVVARWDIVLQSSHSLVDKSLGDVASDFSTLMLAHGKLCRLYDDTLHSWWIRGEVNTSYEWVDLKSEVLGYYQAVKNFTRF